MNNLKKMGVGIFDNPIKAEEYARQKQADIWEIERFMDFETLEYQYLLKIYYFK